MISGNSIKLGDSHSRLLAITMPDGERRASAAHMVNQIIAQIWAGQPNSSIQGLHQRTIGDSIELYISIDKRSLLLIDSITTAPRGSN
jgi:hypothetical protein